MANEAIREPAATRQLQRLADAGVLEHHGLRAEIIAGELVIRGAPRWHHQKVVTRLGARLLAWAEIHGGYAAVGPVGVELDPEHSLRPDVIFVRAERAHLIRDEGLYAEPDLVVEVTSPGTRSLDLDEKRRIHERLGVPEYWVVDLDAQQVLVHRLGDAGYGPAAVVAGQAALEPGATPGLHLTADDLLEP